MRTGSEGADAAASGRTDRRADRDNAAWQAADRRALWHPFTQQRGWMEEDFPVIVGAEGCTLIDADGKRYLDGTSSLWCALHGHRVPSVDDAVRAQLGKVAHSTLLGLGSEASIRLAEELLVVAPGELSRVFFSDSGSSAVEIALKLAFQFWRQTDGPDTTRTRFLCLTDAYHGDTLGAVSVGGIDLFHEIFHPLLFQTTRLPVPRGPSAAVRALDAERCLAALDAVLSGADGGPGGDGFAALVIEPGVQGAAGIRVYPEGFTRAVCERAREAGVLVVLDEVATGFGRSGTLFAAQHEGVAPDLLCLAKGLSAGYLPLAATLATERIHDGFLGEHQDLRTFFHGHTFTGNALACAAASASLALCRAPSFLDHAGALAAALEEQLAPLVDHPHVLEVRRYGTMCGIELVRDRGDIDGHRRGDTDGAPPEPFPLARRTGHRVTVAARARGALVRPLGDTVVLVPPLAMTVEEAGRLVAITREAIDEATRGAPDRSPVDGT